MYAGYTLITSRKLEPRKMLPVILAGMFAGLIGLAIILVLAITVDRGVWGLRLTGRLGAASAAVRGDHIPTVLMVGAIGTLLIEPWVDQLSVFCAQSVHYATC